MIQFVNDHTCNNDIDNNNNNKYNKLCWYCNVFKLFIKIMAESSTLGNIDFAKLFV